MSLREEQCNKVCRILDNVLANRPTERDSLIVAVRKAFAELATDTNVGNKLGTNLAEVGTDTISRQAAIDAIDRHFESLIKRFGYDTYERADEKTKLVCDGLSEAEDVIMGLPSAKSEIIRCKDCRYYNSEEKECLDLMGHGRRWEEDDFCSYAERREVTT